MTTEKELLALAVRAYVYAFPLVFNLDQVIRYTETGVGANPAAPFNSFSHARQLASPADTFVSINNDTVYSMASIDLSVGPVRLNVPDTNGRYYVLQFVDAWTNNFAYIGTRATGTHPGRYLLVPPGWTGMSSPDVTVIHFPTRVGSIVGRWGCADANDLPAIAQLQDNTHLAAVNSSLPAEGLPVPTDADPAIRFFEKFRLWSRALPPAQRDRDFQASFEPLGLTGETPVSELSPETIEILRVGYATGQAGVTNSLRSGSSPVVNGWVQTLHAFDYNLDFFEVGAIDDPRWRIEDPAARYIERAGAALGGLWGNHAYEAAYIMTYVDDAGEQLTGNTTYTLTLSPTPPVGAFWSLTMYNLPHFFLVDNPINRYSVGDRTPGLVYNEDGGLTITISRERPAGDAAAANWLPAPEGEFRPILRMYIPDEAVLSGEYTVPAITAASIVDTDSSADNSR